ncbi:CP12 domain-containing protein [Haematococcus lacustris]|uniref:CP12 domain-containing protein n=1 Tax=Haematococcus lacustris TaxID=44745 RepID=A0A6A0AFQ6_HAELA|nr:CP12 domain-containing protein [Haematococcus lacustris]
MSTIATHSRAVTRPQATASRPCRLACRAGPIRRHAVVARATPTKDLDAKVEASCYRNPPAACRRALATLKEADETCESKGTTSKDCEVAWDQAEELLAAKAHKKAAEKANSDPLEQRTLMQMSAACMSCKEQPAWGWTGYKNMCGICWPPDDTRGSETVKERSADAMLQSSSPPVLFPAID